MKKPGDRVGAVSHQEQKTLFMFGYGVYEGDFFPTEAAGDFAEMGKEIEGYVNPRIKLDSGKVVYGCECWWGSEAAVKKQEDAARVAGNQVVFLDIDEVRKKWVEARQKCSSK